MNQENLIRFDEMSKEEHLEKSSKGGINSGIARRKRKTLKEELLLLLEQGDTQKNMTLSLLAKALDGDIKAFEVVRDTIGEKQKERIEAEVDSKVEIHVGIEDE